MEESKDVKCGKCKSYKYPSQFFKEGRRMKTCSDCRERGKLERKRNKCEHGRQRSQCKDCDGASICEHGRQRSQCKDCGGSGICEHGRQRSKCKDCGGASICEHGRQRSTCKDCGGASICEHGRIRNQCKDCDGSQICEHGRRRHTCKECGDSIKITIKNMLYSSKASDKKRGLYDPINFVDYCFIENLLDDYTHCYYEDCKCELQLVKYQDNLATIERLDNSIGHIKSNCVICCLKCNIMKKSNTFL